jgi:hypothetical protein
MSRYPNPLYDQFAAELNSQLKPPESDIKRSPNFKYGAISSPIHIILSFNLFEGILLMVHKE